jgi:hypothetical protein
MNKGMKIVENHDYVSLRLGNNRTLTANRLGGKVSGAVPNHVTDAWFSLCDGKDGRVGNLIDRIKSFANDLPALWPEWNAAPDTTNFKVGAKGEMFMGKRKGFIAFEIVAPPKRKNGNWTVRFANENHNCLVPADMLAEAKFEAAS